jgi:hypothetical protein
MAEKTEPPTTAEPGAGTPPASFAAAIEAEYSWMIPASGGVVSYMGVAAFGPGDRVPVSHPLFAELKAAELIVPIGV